MNKVVYIIKDIRDDLYHVAFDNQDEANDYFYDNYAVFEYEGDGEWGTHGDPREMVREIDFEEMTDYNISEYIEDERYSK